jgi:hydrogenase/urease accessory protein HupE
MWQRFGTVLCLLLGLLSWAPPAHAHEIRPAYLELTETREHRVHVLWKQPNGGEGALRLIPHLSSGWLEAPGTLASEADSYRVLEWWIAPGANSLRGQTVSIEGLERTMTDVLVRVSFLDGEALTRVLRPLEPSFTLARGDAGEAALGGGDWLRTAREYLQLGVEHILTGVDHLLFVLALLLLVRGGQRIVATISAFTVAHSVTLALATLGWLRAPQAPVEACIALSIAFVAREIVVSARGTPGLTERRPWLVAFGFGLLHGLGFAGALRDVGLPHHALAAALFSFNLGVEIGQVLFVAAFLAVARVADYGARQLRAASVPWFRSRFARSVCGHAIGALAMLWTIERIARF